MISLTHMTIIFYLLIMFGGVCFYPFLFFVSLYFFCGIEDSNLKSKHSLIHNMFSKYNIVTIYLTFYAPTSHRQFLLYFLDLFLKP